MSLVHGAASPSQPATVSMSHIMEPQQVAVTKSESSQPQGTTKKRKERKLPQANSDSTVCDDETILRELVSHYTFTTLIRAPQTYSSVY